MILHKPGTNFTPFQTHALKTAAKLEYGEVSMVVHGLIRGLCRTASLLLLSLAPTLSSAETLVVGSVNDNIRKHIERFTPLANFLEEHLAEDGITEVRISVLPDTAAMASAMRRGDVDLFFDSPLVAANVARLSDGKPFLRRWKKGVSEYHSVLVVPTESPVQSIDDLKGMVVGFQEPDSTSGFMLPVAMLKAAGLEVRELADKEDEVADSEVGYVFTGDDRNTVIWLARGSIDVGATDPRGFDWLQESRPDQYRVIARSIDVPRQVVVQRGDLDPALASRISVVLQDMVNSPEGVETMESFNDTTRFDTFPDGIDATFEPIYEMLEQLAGLGLI